MQAPYPGHRDDCQNSCHPQEFLTTLSTLRLGRQGDSPNRSNFCEYRKTSWFSTPPRLNGRSGLLATKTPVVFCSLWTACRPLEKRPDGPTSGEKWRTLGLCDSRSARQPRVKKNIPLPPLVTREKVGVKRKKLVLFFFDTPLRTPPPHRHIS